MKSVRMHNAEGPTGTMVTAAERDLSSVRLPAWRET